MGQAWVLEYQDNEQNGETGPHSVQRKSTYRVYRSDSYRSRRLFVYDGVGL
jgi:hypothetical protein